MAATTEAGAVTTSKIHDSGSHLGTLPNATVFEPSDVNIQLFNAFEPFQVGIDVRALPKESEGEYLRSSNG